ncbi:Phosphocarrier protein HPr [Micrococcales bacterium KH10]|nr:Phosphocarrier protein HPr [Micrococcales bacterium KH10]
MVTRTVKVASTSGLHARPATIVSQAAAAADVTINIGLPGQEPVDASSILLLMTLGAEHGAQVVLSAEGDGAQEAVDKLAELIETNLDDPAVAS